MRLSSCSDNFPYVFKAALRAARGTLSPAVRALPLRSRRDPAADAATPADTPKPGVHRSTAGTGQRGRCDEPLRRNRWLASTVRLCPVVLHGLAVVAGRTTVLGCTAQVLFGVAVDVFGELLVQRSGPIMDVRGGLSCRGGKLSRRHGCSPSPINVLARGPHLLNARASDFVDLGTDLAATLRQLGEALAQLLGASTGLRTTALSAGSAVLGHTGQRSFGWSHANRCQSPGDTDPASGGQGLRPYDPEKASGGRGYSPLDPGSSGMPSRPAATHRTPEATRPCLGRQTMGLFDALGTARPSEACATGCRNSHQCSPPREKHDQTRAVPGPSVGRQSVLSWAVFGPSNAHQRRPTLTTSDQRKPWSEPIIRAPTRRATDEPTCTPDFVRGDLSPGAVIHLGLPLPADSCGLPAGSGEQPSNACAGPVSGDSGPFLALLRVGFTEPPRSPGVLVGSYPTVSPLPARSRRSVLCGTFPRVTPGCR